MASPIEKFPKEKTSAEIEEINQARKKYEKSLGKRAKSENTFIENITGTGYKKEDIMRNEADYENEQFDEKKANPPKPEERRRSSPPTGARPWH